MSVPSPSPTVSVVIPVFNGAAFLAEAVACVRRQIQPPQQIIIVDDGSTDATPQVARGLGAGIEYVSQKNSGPAAARNRGLELARSDYIAFLDVDDVWPAAKFAVQLAGFASQPAADIVIGPTQLLEEPGAEKTLRKSAPGETFAPPLFYLIGAALFRRTVFARVGGFDAGKRYSEDLDWFIRARESGVAIYCQSNLGLIKRCHDRNMTRGKSIADLGIAAVLHASLVRRRQTDGLARPLHN
ncbi:MAG: glycosyltransferase family 2 protein [Opitutaceae bacterium]|nr:glycosyltransferase family 2 protein [Opitutaceae bacterium]MBP9912281.1 glycosyltransferase family 2 protein [Opitutaceae bacterium]